MVYSVVQKTFESLVNFNLRFHLVLIVNWGHFQNCVFASLFYICGESRLKRENEKNMVKCENGRKWEKFKIKDNWDLLLFRSLCTVVGGWLRNSVLMSFWLDLCF